MYAIKSGHQALKTAWQKVTNESKKNVLVNIRQSTNNKTYEKIVTKKLQKHLENMFYNTTFASAFERE